MIEEEEGRHEPLWERERGAQELKIHRNLSVRCMIEAVSHYHSGVVVEG